jgi:predicted membrane protein DUF2079
VAFDFADAKRRSGLTWTDAAFFLTAMAASLVIGFRHYTAWLKGWLVLDWAIFRAAIDELARWRMPVTLWESFAAPVNHFAVHGHFILAPVAWQLTGDVEGGQGIYAFCVWSTVTSVALGAVLLYSLAIHLGASRRRAFFIGLFLMAYPPLWSQAAPGFHPEAFAMVGLVGFAALALRGMPLTAALFGILAASSREEFGLVLVLLAAAMAYTETDKRRLIYWSAVPGAMFFVMSAALVAMWSMEKADGGFAEQIISSRYGDWLGLLRDSDLTVFDDRVARLRFLFVLGAPLLAGVAWAGRRAWWLVAAAPPLLANLASAYQFQWSDAFYYQVSFLPVVLIVFTVGAVRASGRDKWRAVAAVALLAATLPLSHSVAYLRDGTVNLPATGPRAWRVADGAMLLDARALAGQVPTADMLAVGGVGLADYLDRACLPLEGVVKNGWTPPHLLFRTNGENVEPRWGVPRERLGKFLTGRYRPAARQRNVTLFVREGDQP